MNAESPDELATKLGCRNPHKGHRHFFGGIRDGEIDHLVYAHEQDFPESMGTLLRQGQRSYYVIDRDRTVGTEAVYQFSGFEPPQCMKDAAARRLAQKNGTDSAAQQGEVA